MSDISREEAISRVRVAMLRHMSEKGMGAQRVADDTGYSVKTIWMFLAGEFDSVALCQALVNSYAPVAQLPFVCPHCHRMPFFR